MSYKARGWELYDLKLQRRLNTPLIVTITETWNYLLPINEQKKQGLILFFSRKITAHSTGRCFPSIYIHE